MEHECAEFYVTHRDIVEEKGLDYFIDKACERFSGIKTPMTENLDKCKIGCAMRNVKTFLDSLSFGNVELDKPMEEGDNYFFDNIEPRVTLSSTMCETDRGYDELHIHGKMDLFANGIIIDYKTGKAKSGKEIAKAMDYEDPPERPDFQPLVYLALGKETDLTKREFDLFYAMDNDSQSGPGGYDVRQNVRRVRITDCDDIRFLNDPITMDAVDRGLRFNSGFRKDIPGFIQAISNAVNGPVSGWNDQMSDIVNAVMREFKGSKPGPTANAVKVVLDIMQKGIAGGEKDALVRKQAIDRFLEEVGRKYSEIQSMSVSKDGFPAKPIIDCEKCDYYGVCTKEVINVMEEGNIGD